jgi:hypothetical protein
MSLPSLTHEHFFEYTPFFLITGTIGVLKRMTEIYCIQCTNDVSYTLNNIQTNFQNVQDLLTMRPKPGDNEWVRLES